MSFVIGGGDPNRRFRRAIIVLLITSGVTGLLVVSSAGVVSATSGPTAINPDEDLDGNGTTADPYRITNASELQAMEGNLTASYELANDIDATDTSEWNGGAGFTPIGEHTGLSSAPFDGDPFEGSFDGNGFEIRNLTIDRGDQSYVGLFGYATDGTTIGNVTLRNVEVTGAGHVGAVAGETDGTISNVTVDGAVTTALDGNSPNSDNGARTGGVVGMLESAGTVTDVTANVTVTGSGERPLRIGGLVGYSRGEIRDSNAAGDVEGSNGIGGLVGRNVGHIDNTTAAGNVTGLSETFGIGGLAGYNGRDGKSTGTITGSYATGTVSAVDGTNVGGLIGSNVLAVDTSYATGTVEGDANVGGLVGRNSADEASVNGSYATGNVIGETGVGGLVGYNREGAVSNAYATGEVTGGSSTGGLIGARTDGTVADSFWNVDTTGQTTSVGSDDNDGLSTGDMQGLNATVEMHSFDFEGVWRPGDGTDAYPDLAWDSDFADMGDAYDALVAGDGSSESPYQVSTVYELQRMDSRLDADFVLNEDIDASVTEEWNAGDGFKPIGDNNNRFGGTFDGNDFEIKTLTIDRAGETYVGLFGYASSSETIENVFLLHVNVTGDEQVGALAGRIDDSTVSNVRASGNVTASEGTAEGEEDIGGLVGITDAGSTIADSSFSGNVTGNIDRRIGGLVGANNGLITNSNSTGLVRGADGGGGGGYTEIDAGGLVGKNTGEIQRSFSSATVQGEGNNIGGLVGFSEAGIVNESYATGSVDVIDSGSNLGGLVGFNGDDSEIKNSYATGSIDTENEAGSVSGLVARNDGDIERSFAAGAVGDGDGESGLVANNGGSVTDSYWDINSTGQMSSAGSDDAFGLTTIQMTGSNAPDNMVGFDFSDTWQTVENDYPELRWQNPPTPSDPPSPPSSSTTPPPEEETAVSLSYLDIDGQGPNATITHGNQSDIRVGFENTGAIEGSFDVTLTVVNDSVVEERTASVTIGPGDETTVTFRNVTGDLRIGTYSVTVATESDEIHGEVHVVGDIESARFVVASLTAPGPITEGTDRDITATVRNDGGEAGTASVSLTLSDDDGTVIAREVTTRLQLEFDETETITLAGVTGSLAVGTYTVVVETPDDRATDTIRIEPEELGEPGEDPTGGGGGSIGLPDGSNFEVVDPDLQEPAAAESASTSVQIVGGNFEIGEELHATLTTNRTAGLAAHVSIFNATVLMDGSFTVNVIHSAETVTDAPAYETDGESAVQYISFEIEGEDGPIDATAFANETVQLSVSKEHLHESTTAEDVSFRYHENPWILLDSAFVAETDTHLVFEAAIQDLPDIVVVVRDPAESGILPGWVPSIPGDPGPAEAAAGGITLSLGWILKPFLRDIIGSFLIFSERSFRAGDEIEWGEGRVTTSEESHIRGGGESVTTNSGVITEIGYRSTLIRTHDNTDLTVPNAYLTDVAVVNATAPGPLRLQISVQIDLRANLDLAKEIIRAAAEDHESVRGKPTPEVYFMAFEETRVRLRLHVWIDREDLTDRFEIMDEISASVHRSLAEERIDAEYPTRVMPDPDEVIPE